MRIVVSLLVVLAAAAVWLSAELDTLRARVASLEVKVADHHTDTQTDAELRAMLENRFLDKDYQQLLGLLQSYLIDSHKYLELHLQHTQTSLSLLLSPSRPESEKRLLQEKLEQIKQQAMQLDVIRKNTFEAWQRGMEKYEDKVAAEQSGNPDQAFDERVLEATEQMRMLKQRMSESR